MKILLALLFYISILGWSWGDSLASKNSQANKLYKEGKVDEAMSKWRDAQIDNPDNEKLHYNIGNGLHEQKKYEDAYNEYEKNLDSKNSELKSKTYYNIGNTHYRMGKLQEAVEDYKKCLEINPDDEDAKYNIEFIEKKLKEQPKKEDEQKKESQQKENKDQEQQKQNESSGERKEQDKEQKQSESQKSEKDDQKQEKEDQAQQEKEQQKLPEEKEDEMSKEDAVRLLDAFNDDEKDLQKELRNQPGEGRYKVDKDW